MPGEGQKELVHIIIHIASLCDSDQCLLSEHVTCKSSNVMAIASTQIYAILSVFLLCTGKIILERI